MFTRKLSSWVFGLGLLGFGASAIGCGGMAPGDYIIYKIALSESKNSASCYYPLDGAPPSEKSDSDSGRKAAQWILTAGLEDAFYLDVDDDTTLVGAATDDGYAFNRKIVNVDYDGDDVTQAKRTTTDTIDISMTVDGSTVSGTVAGSHSEKCTNSGSCPPPTPTCKTTTEFTGGEVDDVELQHEVK